MHPIKATRLFVLLAALIPTCPASLVDTVFANADIPFLDSSTPSKRAQTLNYVSYSITFDGRGEGNFEDFQVSGTMIATDGISSVGTTNGPNAADVYISIGAPAANPITGSIRYFSNRGLYSLAGGTNAQSLLDFATVSVEGDTTTFVVDPALAAANQLSGFNARSGLLADVYLIASGSFRLRVTPDGVLSGVVDVVGRGFIEPGMAPYKATVSGKATGKGVFNV